MHKSATKCNEIQGKWCKNKHGASKIIDTFETYQWCAISGAHTTHQKGLTSLLLLTAWELWNEKNTRVFQNVASMPTLLICNIKSSAALGE
jgi:hypothetical protein